MILLGFPDLQLASISIPSNWIGYTALIQDKLPHCACKTVYKRIQVSLQGVWAKQRYIDKDYIEAPLNLLETFLVGQTLMEHFCCPKMRFILELFAVLCVSLAVFILLMAQTAIGGALLRTSSCTRHSLRQ